MIKVSSVGLWEKSAVGLNHCPVAAGITDAGKNGTAKTPGTQSSLSERAAARCGLSRHSVTRRRKQRARTKWKSWRPGG